MGLSELSDMYRNGEISAREANELDGMDDDRICCSICKELFDEDDLSNCDLCGCLVCEDCHFYYDSRTYCSEECARNDS